MKPEIDEQMLTAYVMGELDPAGVAAVERLLATDEPARRMVDEIRTAATAVSAALGQDPAIRFDRPVPTPPVDEPRPSKWWARAAMGLAASVVVGGILTAVSVTRDGRRPVALVQSEIQAQRTDARPPQQAEQKAAKPDAAAPTNEANRKLSYSNANPFPPASAVGGGYKLNSSLPTDLALGADKNPGAARADMTEKGKLGQAPQQGQGAVAMGDGHVESRNNLLGGVQRDDLYAANRPAAVVTSRANPNGTAVLPTEDITRHPNVEVTGGPRGATAAGANRRGGQADWEKILNGDRSGRADPKLLEQQSQEVGKSLDSRPSALSDVPAPATATPAPTAAVAPQPGRMLAVRGTIVPLEGDKAAEAYRLYAGARFERLPDLRQKESADANGVYRGPIEHNTESYDRIEENPFLAVDQNPLSTFSADVDTASYSNVRRFIESGQRPPVDAVRIEELVNYFPYDYAPPTSGKDPFAAHLEVAECPWAPSHRLVRIGIKGKVVAEDERPAANLVFLIDVSGSMNQPNKLPLVKQSLKLLAKRLRTQDRVAMVVYAGNSGLVLPSTSAGERDAIERAIDNLQAGGSTNGAAGIELAYQTAQSSFLKEGTNRVILCTDGDWNVGVTDQGALTRLIEDKAKTGTFLTVLGFGMGNLKDSTMVKLADKGNGDYGYIDSPAEAKKLLVEQLSGTLVTIAKDVKLQVEFNPAKVGSYRLIGYEKRKLAKEDFNDDKKDAGEIGAGHTVTALYEVVPVGVAPATTQPGVDALKYQSTGVERRIQDAATPGEMLTVKVRYKQPDGDTSTKLEFPLTDASASFAKASPDFKFAAAVAEYGMLLRDSAHKGSASLGAVVELAEDGLGPDAAGYRKEFVSLVKRTQAMGLMLGLPPPARRGWGGAPARPARRPGRQRTFPMQPAPGAATIVQ